MWEVLNNIIEHFTIICYCKFSFVSSSKKKKVENKRRNDNIKCDTFLVTDLFAKLKRNLLFYNCSDVEFGSSLVETGCQLLQEELSLPATAPGNYSQTKEKKKYIKY